MTVHDSAKSEDLWRKSFSSSNRRMTMPSLVTWRLASVTLASASRMELPRWLAARNINVGTPSKGATTATFEKTTRAIGREKRANIMEVKKARYV